MMCPWNKKFRCQIPSNWGRSRNCPIYSGSKIAKWFMEDIEKWALTGRTPKAIGFDKFLECSPGTNNIDDFRQVIKSEMASNFENPLMILSLICTNEFINKKEDFEKLHKKKLDWDQDFGQVLMGEFICNDFLNGYDKWKRKKGF